MSETELNISQNDTALYGRQSLDKKDSVSIEAQLSKGRAVCTANGWEIYKEYYDKGYSGKDINRPEFQKLLKDIEHGYIKRVIVYRLDRISRSITDFANLLNFFGKYDVTFISATENFDTSSPLGRAMIYIIMVFAQLERETIAERITDNYYFRAKQGLFMGGGVPYRLYK
jgi:DNA invertase Pin-like site-specific DNA recombinase